MRQDPEARRRELEAALAGDLYFAAEADPADLVEVQNEAELAVVLDEFGEAVVRWFEELSRRLPGTPREQVCRQAVAKAKRVMLGTEV